MIEDTGGAAFPRTSDQHGVTWVDWMAGQVAAGLAARMVPPAGTIDPVQIADDAYEIAKAMKLRRELP